MPTRPLFAFTSIVIFRNVLLREVFCRPTLVPDHSLLCPADDTAPSVGGFPTRHQTREASRTKRTLAGRRVKTVSVAFLVRDTCIRSSCLQNSYFSSSHQRFPRKLSIQAAWYPISWGSVSFLRCFPAIFSHLHPSW